MRTLVLVLGAALTVFSTGALAAAKKKPAAKPRPAAVVSPCVDFYANVNADWIKAHPLSPGTASISRWDAMNAEAEQRSRDLLARTSSAAGPASTLLADIVASAGNTAGLDAAARAAAQPLVAQIAAIRKPRDVIRAVEALHAAGTPVLFGFDSLRDPDTGQPRATFYPGGLGLPDPGYYVNPAPELQRAVAAYQAQLPELLRFSGVPEAQLATQAASAFALEQQLAQAMGGAGAETLAIAQVQKSYPALSLPDFMQGQGAAPSLVRLQQPAFFRALDAMLARPAVAQWQAYLRVQLALSLAPAMARDPRLPWLSALGAAPAQAAAPTTSDRLLWSRVDGAELYSAAYAETYGVAADEARAKAIAEAVRAAMDRAIGRAAWLAEPTRAEAARKLAAMRLAIGKAAEPVDFSGLRVDRNSYAGNLMALRRWNRGRALARLASAVYPWPVSQSQPIIGYQPAENRLIVTTAALRPPALETGASSATDYGSFGAPVGQQMAIAFADFTGTDGRGLATRQAPLVPQFDAYTATGTIKVNGLRTQRQNSADQAGVELAWDALNATGPADASAAKDFFRAWAATWARNDSAATLAQSTMQSVFAPAQWRVNGPLSNLPAFAATYSCKAGQPMARAPASQVAIWR